ADGGAAERLFSYRERTAGFRGVLGGCVRVGGGSAAHVGAAAAGHETEAVPGGVPGERGAVTAAMTSRREFLRHSAMSAIGLSLPRWRFSEAQTPPPGFIDLPRPRDGVRVLTA